MPPGKKLKIGISACLLGVKCRYDGCPKTCPMIYDLLKDKVRRCSDSGRGQARAAQIRLAECMDPGGRRKLGKREGIRVRVFQFGGSKLRGKLLCTLMRIDKGQVFLEDTY